MRTLGIDIGSRYIKAALVTDGKLISFDRRETSCEPLESCRLILEDMGADRVMATGYGRHLLEIHGDIPTVTEIKAFARGAREFFPACRTVIDIGGQDTKVISLDVEGRVRKFEMNDRCAAGTGKFLEVMARTLGYDMAAFGTLPADEEEEIRISSMCTVFAESEVVSLIARGVSRSRIAKSINQAVAVRVVGMVKRFPIEEEIVFAGGCAHSPLLRGMLEKSLGKKLFVPSVPEITGALGAALCAVPESA